MNKKISKDDIITIAEEMFEDGTRRCERYSEHMWHKAGWFQVEDDEIYEIIDSYLKFRHHLSSYNTRKEKEIEKEEGIVGRIKRIRDKI